MNGRGGIFKFFLFLFLSVIICLQILSMIQSDRFYRLINRLDEVRQQDGRTTPTKTSKEADSFSEQGNSADEGDWLVWAFRVEPKTLVQVSTENDIYSRWITVPYIFEPLLTYDYNEIKLKPWLAESYEISDDELEIIFHLRKDAWFSDNVPVTADDVIFTYETIINPEIDAANIANLYDDVEKAVKIDKYTVKFLMKRPYFKALENLSFWDIGILPKHIYEFKNAEEFNKRVSNPVGSGPYVFEKWDTGKEIVLRQNENYWGQKPKLKKIVYRFITNAVAAVQALRSHQVDIIIPEPDQFAEFEQDEGFKKKFYCLSYFVPGTPFYFIGWNQDTPFFSDRLVRLAMTHLIDRDKIISQLLKGYGRRITGPFYIEGPNNDPTIKPWPYDPEKAKELLDQAGWIDRDGDGLRDKNGVPFRFKFMYSSENVQYERLAKFIKDELSRVGIEVVPEPFEWSIVITRLTDRKFDATVMGWGGDILEDPYQLWHSSQCTNRGVNYIGFRNKQADDLISQIRRTLDEEKRTELFYKLHQILHYEQPYTFLFARPTFRPVDRRFKNVKIYKLGPKYWQWYVPKAEQRYN